MTDLAAAGRYLGARVPRVEDARLLTGHGTYVDDIGLPGMLHGCFLRSQVPHARIVSVDVGEAEALPGVVAVFTAAELNPHVREQWHGMVGQESPETPRPPLAESVVRFVGDPIVLVFAEDRYIAEDACELVVVDLEPLPAVVDFMDALESDVLVHESHRTNLIGEMAGLPSSALDPVFEAAAEVVEARIDQQAQNACPMETRGLVVERDPSTGDITLHMATQAPHEARAFCARLLGLPEHRVRVIARDTGGAFGQKIMFQREEMCVVLASTMLHAPLKWIEDRQENLLAAGQSRHESANVRLAFDAEGCMLAADIEFFSDCGAYPTPWPVGTSALTGAVFPGPYRTPKGAFSCKSIYTNTVGRSAYRGPWMFETLAREVLIDIGARHMNLDPIELRRRNLLCRGDMPWTNPSGLPFDNVSPLETFDRTIEALDYERFRRDQAEARRTGRYLGVGVSNYIEPTAGASGILGTEAATIRVEPSGKVNVYMAGGSAGNSLETTAVQLAAEMLGVRIEDVATIQGDTALTGYGAGTGGSRSGPMMAGAIGATAQVLRHKIIEIAAHRLEAAPEDIELVESVASVRGTPAKALSLQDVAQIAYFQAATLPPEIEPGLEATSRYKPQDMMTWANATHLCTCEVDVSTGQVALLRYIVGEDCGPMINPNVVEGQIAGGTIQGIAGALYEHLAVDPDGNPITTTFMDYLVPTTTEVPTIEYVHEVTPSRHTGGYKGVGEGGAIGAPAAVVNAVADALSPFGARITRTPMTPEYLLSLIAPH
jgi:carbon-monoxide dehydrogenase large subunit